MSWIPRSGTDFAGYRVEDVIGHGGMSVVYRAQHLALERTVALKFLAPNLTEDEAFRSRFVRESRIAASLEHPNVIPIYEAGEAEGIFFIAMRYVDGSDLKSILRKDGPLDLPRTSSILAQVAAALDVAHARGLVHRDIKPANILISAGAGVAGTDHVYVSDFGIAKQTREPGVTRTGLFVGTADYAAPEQIEGRSVDGRADVYALGCVLFECLTGVMPYEKDSEVAMMYAHLLEAPPSVGDHRPDLPPELDAVIATAMAKAPDDRYSSGREFATTLRELVRRGGGSTVGSGIRAPAAPAQRATPVSGETIVDPQRAALPTTAPAPPAAGPPGPPEGPGPEAAAGDGAGRRRRPRVSRGMLALGAAAALGAVAAAVVTIVVTGGDSSPSAAQSSTPGTTAPPTTSAAPGGPLTLQDVIPKPLASGCTALNTPRPGALATAVCSPPAGFTGFSPDRWEVSSYASGVAAEQAYESDRRDHTARTNFGRCDGNSWGGEGTWSHGPGKPGGRRFCYFDGDDAVIVWTHARLGQPNHLDTVSTARVGGSDHTGLFGWWRFWHHRIGKTA